MKHSVQKNIHIMLIFLLCNHCAITQEDREEQVSKRVVSSSCCINFKELADRTNASSPVDGVVPVMQGGTGVSALTAYALLSAGATSTAPILMVGPGASTNLIVASNASAASSFKQLSSVRSLKTSSGTYAPTTGMICCVFECIGGGGGGGACAATANFLAAGGGSGGYGMKVFTVTEINALGSLAYVIGAAGSGGTGGGAGSNGGTTYFSNSIIVSGSGGFGGAAGNSSAVVGGVGGTGVGDGTISGFSGGSTTNFNNAGAFSGAGANSLFGQGGYAVAQNSTGGIAGRAGQGYGAGGSGATAGAASPSAVNGGSGTAGVIVITEYILN